LKLALKDHEYQAYEIIDTDFNQLLSNIKNHDSDTGHALSLNPRLKNFLWSGETITSHPLPSTLALPNGQGSQIVGLPTILVASPIYNQQHEIIAALCFYLDPEKRFASILKQPRVGASTEAYIFNRSGQLLSHSRFSDQLVRQRRLVSPDYQHSLYFSLSTDSNQALIHSVDAAISRGAGKNLQGYPDYRNVRVVGAWTWDADWDIGLVVERDYLEAYALSQETKYVTNLLTALAILLLLTTFSLFTYYKNREKNTSRRMDLYLSNIKDAIITIDENGKILSSKGAAESMLGYREFELVGKHVNTLRAFPGDVDPISHSPELHGIHDIRCKKKDGSTIDLRDITKRKSMEAQLNKNQEQLEEIIAHRTALLNQAQKLAHVGHWDWDLLTDIIECSQELYEIYRLDTDQPITLDSILERTHPDDRQSLLAHLELTKSRHDIDYKFSHRLCFPSSEIRYVYEHATFQYDHSGQAVRMVGIVQDVTELRRAQRQLANNEERYRTLVNTIPGIVYTSDMSLSSLLYISDYAEQMTGYKPSTFLEPNGISLDQLVHPSDLAKVTRVRNNCLNSGGHFSIEYRLIDKAKDIHWVYEQGTYYEDAENHYLSGLIMDISERVSAELALKNINTALDHRIIERTAELDDSKRIAISLMRDAEREKKRAEESLQQLQISSTELEKLKQAVEQSPVSVIITDTNGIMEYVNPCTASQSLFDEDELIGSNPRIFQSGIHDEDFYKFLWGTITSGNVWSGEICNRKKDGTLIWERSVIAPVLDKDNNIINYVSVKEDISEQRALHESLIKAKDEAEAATKAKSAFLAMMSHEIRTPINGVVGVIDLLKQTDLNPEQYHLTTIAKDSAISLLQIINDILDFSKIEADKMTMDYQPVNWSSLVQGVVESLIPQLKSRNIHLYCSVSPSVPQWLLGDPVRLRQILVNLINNAIKFTSTTDDQAGLIEVRVYLSTNNCLVLDVIDSGIGMSPEQREKLFKPFTQSDNTIQRRFGGTGLGLAICARFCELMHGSISCTSTLGKGSVFTVRLPVKTPETELADLIQSDIDDLDILLVSTDELVNEILKEHLQDKARLVCLQNLSQVSDSLQTQQADVIIFNCNWPNSDIQLCRQQLQSNYPDQGFVILSPEISIYLHSNDHIVQLASWPFRPQALLEAIQIAAGRMSVESADNDETPFTTAVDNQDYSILVAEDHKTNQEVFRRQLSLLGYNAVIADDGQIALDYFQNQSFSLLLTDCHMPNMDGFELTKAIRELESESDKHLPIIAISANAIHGERERCLQAGMDDYLSKPVVLDQLNSTLRHWLPKSKAKSTITEYDVSSKLADTLNYQRLVSILGDDPSIHIKYVNKFFNQSAPTMTEMEISVSQRDYLRIQDNCHKLKSSALTIGADQLGELFQKLELAAREEDTESIDSLWPVLTRCYQEIKQALLG
jgi:PAS domain S-box-containing protein